MTRSRAVLAALLAVLGLDLLVVIVTGSSSILPGLSPVGAAGFVARAAAAAVLLVFTWRGDRAAGARPRAAAAALIEFQLIGRAQRRRGHVLRYTRSLVKDGDVDFTNEYTHYELIGRGDLGHAHDDRPAPPIFSIGPGLVSVPSSCWGSGGAPADGRDSPRTCKHGPEHVNAVRSAVWPSGSPWSS
jgi:hypothetical protein